MDRNFAETIRQQSDDLRDELKALEQWETEVEKRTEANKKRSAAAAVAPAAVEPPIRGTVASIKEAMEKQSKAAGTSPAAAAAQPTGVQIAKDKGNEYFRLGKVEDAVEAYSEGILLDPYSSTTHVLYANRAMCYLKQGKWGAAEKDATTCIQMNTSYAKAYFRRAVARKNLGRLKDARTDLEAALALAPNDASATAELAEVTRKIQEERAQPTSASAVPGAKKKRIVIEEVEDEDEENDRSETAKKPAGKSLSPEETSLRQERIETNMRELEEARRRQAEESRQAALREEQRMARASQRNNRVEVIEEVEEDETPAPATAPVQAQAKPAPTPAPKHVDVKPASSSKPVPAASAPRARPLPALESLTAPASFTEFEHVFDQVSEQATLRDAYVKLLQPSTFPTLFGSNMTPEMLVGLLRSVKTFAPAMVLEFAQGLSKVNRIENITMFLNGEEKKEAQTVLDILTNSGIPAKDVQAIQKKLKPF